MKLEIYCDSGANIHSCRKTVISLDEMGIDEQEWNEMSEEAKEEAVKPIAFENLDWGWKELS
jgi:hypothetical protein